MIIGSYEARMRSKRLHDPERKGSAANATTGEAQRRRVERVQGSVEILGKNARKIGMVDGLGLLAQDLIRGQRLGRRFFAPWPSAQRL